MEKIYLFLRWLKYAGQSLCRLPLKMWHWYVGLYKEKPWWKRTLLVLCSMVFLLFFYVFSVGVNLLWLFGRMPLVDDILHPENEEASVIYSADGQLLGKFFKENRTPVAYADVNPFFFTTLIDTEDERFYLHHGVDFKGIGAAIKDILRGNPRGASTITQQLAKNMFRVRTRYSTGLLGRIPGIRILIMKTKEAIVATQLEMCYTKPEILRMYVNTVDFGSNAFGIRTAAKTYFDTTPKDLRPEQCAVLVGLLKATSTYNPHTNYDNSLRRRNVVLNNLYSHGHLSLRERDSLSALPIDISHYRIENASDGSAPYLRQEIAAYLKDKFDQLGLGSVDLYSDGLKIYTTIDSRMQRYAESAVIKHLKNLQRSFQPTDRVLNRYTNYVIKTLPRYRQLQSGPPDSLNHFLRYEIDRPHTLTINDPYLGPRTVTMSTRDSIRTMLSFLQAGFVVIEGSSHHVKAWVGNLNFRTWNHDNVVGRHQVGSTFKGIVYTEAMEQGWSPCNRIADLPPEDAILKKTKWSGRQILLRSAFQWSKNGAAINLCAQVGPKNVIRLSRKMGITGKLYTDAQNLTLGSSSLRLNELVNAYAVILAGGYYRPPIVVTKVVDRNGKVVYSEQTEARRKVISSRTAFLMQQMLMAGMEGTSRSLYNYISPYMNTTDFGGKTGTTNESADALFIGVIPNLVGGVWVGGEYRDIHPYGSGSTVALPVWGTFIQKVMGDTRFSRYKRKFAKMGESVVPKRCYQCGSYGYRPSNKPKDSTSVATDAAPAEPSAEGAAPAPAATPVNE